MTFTRGRAVVVLFASAGAWAACNIWPSLENCETDFDCGLGRVCNARGKFCEPAPPGPEAGRDAEVDAGATDADAEAAPPREAGPCDLEAPFEKPSPVQVLINGAVDDRGTFSARLSPDEKIIYLARDNGAAGTDLFFANRASTQDPFVLGYQFGVFNELNTAADEYWPSLGFDGLSLLYESSRTVQRDDAGSFGRAFARIWYSRRNANIEPFPLPDKPLPLFGDAGLPESSPYYHPLGKSLYFASAARGDGSSYLDLYVAKLNAVVPTSLEAVAAVNTADEENHPVVSDDESFLYFSRPDDGDDAHRNIFVSRRGADAGFQKDTPVAELNTRYDEFPSWVSPDGCRLYFISDRPDPTALPDAAPTRHRVWVAEKP
jgi:hypothetical protein